MDKALSEQILAIARRLDAELFMTTQTRATLKEELSQLLKKRDCCRATCRNISTEELADIERDEDDLPGK